MLIPELLWRRHRAMRNPPPPISMHHPSVKGLTGKLLGTFDVPRVIQLSAGVPLQAYNVRILIGLDRNGVLMVTPNLNPPTHLVWERWAGPDLPA